MRKQICVYWGVDYSSAAYDEFGQSILLPAVQLKCRWQDVIEEFVDAKGAPRISNSKIFTGIDIVPGGYLKLCSLSDLSSAGNSDPRVEDAAWEVKRFDKMPTLKGNKFLRTSYV